MRSAVLTLGLIGLVMLAVFMTCGTWVMREQTELHHGLEYAIMRGQWQWYPRATIVRSLSLLCAVGLLLAAVAVIVGWRRPPAPLTTGRASSAIEQRQFPRLGCSWPVRYNVRSLPFERPASCVNLSAGGMQCLMQECWVRSTPLELRLHPPEGPPIALSGTVVWARAAHEAGGQPCHRIGIRFERPTSQQQMSVLVRLLAGGGGLTGGAA